MSGGGPSKPSSGLKPISVDYNERTYQDFLRKDANNLQLTDDILVKLIRYLRLPGKMSREVQSHVSNEHDPRPCIERLAKFTNPRRVERKLSAEEIKRLCSMVSSYEQLSQEGSADTYKRFSKAKDPRAIEYANEDYKNAQSLIIQLTLAINHFMAKRHYPENRSSFNKDIDSEDEGGDINYEAAADADRYYQNLHGE